MDNYDEKKILGEALEILIEEKLKLQQGKKMGFEVDDIAVDAAINEIEKKQLFTKRTVGGTCLKLKADPLEAL